MAHASSTSPIARSIVSGLQSISDAIFNWMVRVGERSSRGKRIEAMFKLSDAELAARGLRRQDIARHVLHNQFWI